MTEQPATIFHDGPWIMVMIVVNIGIASCSLRALKQVYLSFVKVNLSTCEKLFQNMQCDVILITDDAQRLSVNR
jgi:hypothetical protein